MLAGQGLLPVRWSYLKVVFLLGCLPISSYSYDVVFLWSCIPMRSYSYEVVFLLGCLPIRSFFYEVVLLRAIFLGGRLPWRSSSYDFLFWLFTTRTLCYRWDQRMQIHKYIIELNSFKNQIFLHRIHMWWMFVILLVCQCNTPNSTNIEIN